MEESNDKPLMLMQSVLDPDKENLQKLKENLLSKQLDFNLLRKYKKSDFRRELILKHIKELKRFSRLTRKNVSVQLGPQPNSPSSITVDTSKAGSNIDVIRLCLQNMKWREFPNGKPVGKCDLYWLSTNFHEHPNLHNGYVNKFPGMNNLLHKVNLTRTLETMRILFPSEYNFYPLTWYLPHQLPEFTTHCREQKSVRPTFIVKPDLGSQGEGIYLIRDPQDYVASSRNHIVQEYLENPLLLENYKFDFRIYVVLISVDPLKVYICKEGLARLCTIPYCKPNTKNIQDVYMHLTNYSLNKSSKTYVHTNSEHDGSKRTVSSVFYNLESKGFDVAKLWSDIESLVCKTVIAVLPELKVHLHVEIPSNKNGPKCFHILGFDIIILDNLKVMLLEVNSSPSLRLDYEMDIAPGIPEYIVSPVDIQIKEPLVQDTLKLLEPILRSQAKGNQPLKTVLNEQKSSNNSSDHDLWLEDGHKDTRYHVSSFADFSEIRSEPQQALHGQQQVAFQFLADGEEPPPALRKCLIDNDLEVTCKEPPIETFRNGDVTYVVSGTSPRIRRRARQIQARFLRKREKSWLRKDAATPVTMSDESMSKRADSSRPLSRSNTCFGECDLSHRSARSQREFREYRGKFDELDNESCLEEIYPAKWGERLSGLRVLEQIMEVFLTAIGIRANFKMGPTAFRTFARKCQLSQLGFTLATIDIMYIDLQRRWEYLNQDGGSGLCFQGFVEAFVKIAFQKYSNEDKTTAIALMIRHCQKFIHGSTSGAAPKPVLSQGFCPTIATKLALTTTPAAGLPEQRDSLQLQKFVQQRAGRMLYVSSPQRAYTTLRNNVLPSLTETGHL